MHLQLIRVVKIIKIKKISKCIKNAVIFPVHLIICFAEKCNACLLLIGLVLLIGYCLQWELFIVSFAVVEIFFCELYWWFFLLKVYTTLNTMFSIKVGSYIFKISSQTVQKIKKQCRNNALPHKHARWKNYLAFPIAWEFSQIAGNLQIFNRPQKKLNITARLLFALLFQKLEEHIKL